MKSMLIGETRVLSANLPWKIRKSTLNLPWKIRKF